MSDADVLGHRFLTLATVVRVRQIEITRDRALIAARYPECWAEAHVHAPASALPATAGMLASPARQRSAA